MNAIVRIDDDDNNNSLAIIVPLEEINLKVDDYGHIHLLTEPLEGVYLGSISIRAIVDCVLESRYIPYPEKVLCVKRSLYMQGLNPNDYILVTSDGKDHSFFVFALYTVY
jgi:hypothetical protein